MKPQRIDEVLDTSAEQWGGRTIVQAIEEDGIDTVRPVVEAAVDHRGGQA
jgi:hypothetical protein